jgi:hypothetical protein
MKKNLFNVASVIMLAGVVTFTSCKKDDTTAPTLTDDTTAPTLTVTGGNSQSQSLPNTAGNGTWSDPSATATDDEDGDLTGQVSVSGTVDPNTKGTYTLTYSVSDAAGNTATEVVTVMVVNDAEHLAGSYNVVDSIGSSFVDTYTQTVTTSNTINNRIHFNKFANYSGNTGIYANISGSTVVLPSQTANNIGSLSEDHTFSGNGTVTGNNFTLFYTDMNISQAASAACRAYFTHQ